MWTCAGSFFPIGPSFLQFYCFELLARLLYRKCLEVICSFQFTCLNQTSLLKKIWLVRRSVYCSVGAFRISCLYRYSLPNLSLCNVFISLTFLLHRGCFTAKYRLPFETTSGTLHTNVLPSTLAPTEGDFTHPLQLHSQ